MYKMTNDLYLNYKMSSLMDVAYDSDIVLIWVSIIMYDHVLCFLTIIGHIKSDFTHVVTNSLPK